MIYKSLLKPLLFQFDAEKAHDFTLDFAKKVDRSALLSSLTRHLYQYKSPLLSQTFHGITFPNPVGLAAGFDKNGQLVRAMQKAGLGFVEVGSVTAEANCGNPKPRAFRLPKDEALINRMGLNNDGAQTIVKRLQNARFSIPIGINIAKTHDPDIMGEAAIEDYYFSYQEAQKIADYITINISCPNTASGKTFEDPNTLNQLLERLVGSQTIDPVPTLVKFSSDIDDNHLQELLEICASHHVDGYVACNTSSSRSGLNTDESTLKKIGNGGLSGAPLTPKSLHIVQIIRDYVGPKPLLIGVGGVNSYQTALNMLKAGANLLQIYTGLVYEGPALVKQINKGLVDYIKKNELESVKEI